MKKSPPPQSLFIFTLINSEANYIHFSTTFSFINFLFYVEESNIHRYVEYLHFFTAHQFRNLNRRVLEKRSRIIPMNQQHLIIFYAVLKYMVEIFKSEKEFAILKEEFSGQALIDMDKVQDYLTAYAGDSMAMLQKDYKRNYAVTVAFAKINAYKMPGC